MKAHPYIPRLISFLSLFACVFIFPGIKAQSSSISISPSVQCLQGFSTTSSASVSVASATSYSWSALSTSPACSPSISIIAANGSLISIFFPCCDVYTLTCLAYNGATLISTLTNTATVLCSPVISITGNTTICGGSTTTLSASGAQSYTWSTLSVGSQVVLSPTTSACYTVVGFNTSGCPGMASACVNVQPPPNASFIYSVNPGGNVTFTSTSSPTSTQGTCTWNFGNNTSSVIASPVVTTSANYTTNGSYTVSLGYYTGGSCTGTSIVTSVINVTTAPCGLNAGYTYSIGGNLTNTFVSTTTGGGGATTYSWSYGDGTGGVGSPGVHTYSVPGNYVVTLTAINYSPGCTSTHSSVVTAGVVNFTANPGSSGNYTFTSTSAPTNSNTNYSWNFGAGSTYTALGNNTAVHTYTTNGVYVVSLTVTNFSPLFSSTTTQTFVVTSFTSGCNLVANFSYSQLYNGGINFYNSSTGIYSGSVYLWDFGDNTASTASSPSHIYPATGIYTVSLHVSDTLFPNSCASNKTMTVSVCSVNFAYTSYPGGSVTFTGSAAPGSSITSYIWYYSNGANFQGQGPSFLNSSTTYTNSSNTGTAFFAMSSAVPFCSVGITQTVNLNCNIAAGFSYSLGSNGLVTFTNNSSGTASSVSYVWKFGDNSSALTLSPAHTYSANGVYSVTLKATNNFTTLCSDSVTIPVIVSGITNCSLNANFTPLTASSPTINFVSTSTGTVAGTTYSWNYGDATTGTGLTSSHTYSTQGTFIVTLTANNNATPTCLSSKTLAVAVTINTLCNLQADFTHTVGSGGVVNFADSSSGINSSTIHYWNFGDGIYSAATNPTHTYSSAGTYYVRMLIHDTLNASCYDSLTESINITGISCLANSNFTLTQTSTPHYWTATPAYPWNITAATWSWGDGTISNTLYTSHLYSVSATYSICLSVTVSCGSSSTYCYPYYVYKSTEDNNVSSILSINVVAPGMSTAVENIKGDNVVYTIYPNPNTGIFNIRFESAEEKNTTINIYDLIGKTIYSAEEKNNEAFVKNIQLNDIPNGIYSVKISSGAKTLTQKIVINK